MRDGPALRGDAEAVDVDDLPNKMVEFLATIADLCRAYAALSARSDDLDRCFASFLDLASGDGTGAYRLALTGGAGGSSG